MASLRLAMSLQMSHNACLLKTEDSILIEKLCLIAYRDLFPMKCKGGISNQGDHVR